MATSEIILCITPNSMTSEPSALSFPLLSNSHFLSTAAQSNHPVEEMLGVQGLTLETQRISSPTSEIAETIINVAMNDS
jgi:hypothetical protein